MQVWQAEWERRHHQGPGDLHWSWPGGRGGRKQEDPADWVKMGEQGAQWPTES